MLGYLLGYIAMVDYYGDGVLLVLLLYLFHGVRFERIGQTTSMALVNLGLCGLHACQWFDLRLASCVMFGVEQTEWVTHGSWMFCLPFIGPGCQ